MTEEYADYFQSNISDYDDNISDETSLLIKDSTNKRTKKSEKIPLLYTTNMTDPGENQRNQSPSLRHNNNRDPEFLIDRPEIGSPDVGNACSSDDDTVRMCNEKYAIYGNDFAQILIEAIRAINHGIDPDRIVQGSSGSYFVRNMRGDRIGVFKPKNEEPYGHMNPKWLKWLHKVFFPCCFGRSCLVPNQGYLSETGASLVDQKLGLGIVPKTGIVKLAANTFNYSKVDRAIARSKEQIQRGLGHHFRRVGLPPKRGSFQLYVQGFNDASHWVYGQWQNNLEKHLSPDTLKEFQLQFERMVILDYIIRNTDRGRDNWLIKIEVPNELMDDEGNSPRPLELLQSQHNLSERPQTLTISESLKCLDEEIEKKEMNEFGDDAKIIDIHEAETILDVSIDPSAKSEGQLKADLGPKETAANDNSTISICGPSSSSATTNNSGKQGRQGQNKATKGVGGEESSDFSLIEVENFDQEGTRERVDVHLWEEVRLPRVQIAAIDNGLAFPFKHPDEWRSYPYGWIPLSLSQKPFSDETITKILPLLSNTDFVLELGSDLKKIFETDPGFDKKTFNKQLSVMYGQIYNLIEALRSKKSPFQLVQMPLIYMIETSKKKKKRAKKREQTYNESETLNTDIDAVSNLPTGAAESIDGTPQSCSGNALPESSSASGQIPVNGDAKSWYNTFEQKVQTRSAFFSMC